MAVWCILVSPLSRLSHLSMYARKVSAWYHQYPQAPASAVLLRLTHSTGYHNISGDQGNVLVTESFQRSDSLVERGKKLGVVLVAIDVASNARNGLDVIQESSMRPWHISAHLSVKSTATRVIDGEYCIAELQ
jgi:hypothetical protein